MNEVTKVEPVEHVLPADPMVSMIERVAMDPNLPIERLSALMDMRERQMDKEAEQSFNQAFSAAMGEMPNVPKTGENKHTHNTYSTLDDLIRTTRPVLASHGLSLNWEDVPSDGVITVMATVRHALGHSISTTRSGPPDSGKQMNALQGTGSTTTYLKRYTGFSILGLSSGDEHDDDGNGSNAGATIGQSEIEWIEGAVVSLGLKMEVVLTAERLNAIHDLPQAKYAHVRAQLMTTAKQRGVEL